eukprot:596477-Rhodomonas_salina.1
MEARAKYIAGESKNETNWQTHMIDVSALAENAGEKLREIRAELVPGKTTHPVRLSDRALRQPGRESSDQVRRISRESFLRTASSCSWNAHERCQHRHHTCCRHSTWQALAASASHSADTASAVSVRSGLGVD